MTTTIDLQKLPHQKEFLVLYNAVLEPGKEASMEVRKSLKTAFFVAYWRLHELHGDSKSPFDYLELLLQDDPELLAELLVEAKTLFPDEAALLDTETEKADEDTAAQKLGWRERLGAKLGPKDTDKKKEEEA